MVSFMVLGIYYSYDSLNPIGELLKKDLGITAARFGILKQTATSVPNLIILIFGGILIDRVGSRLGGGIFACLCLLGTIVTAVGGQFSSYWMMLMGRVIFGSGVEAFIVAQSKITTKWFKGKELSLAFATSLSICRFGTFFAFNSMNGLSDAFGWRGALWCITALVGAGVVVFAIYAVLDRRMERAANVSEERSEQVDLKQISGLPKSFWYIALLCVTFYCAVFPFMDFAPQIFEARFDMDSKFGSPVTSLVILLTIIFTPMFGWVCDKFGKRATMMTIGAFMIIPIHLSIGFLKGGAGARPIEPLIDFYGFQWYAVFPLNSIDIIPILPVMALGVAFSLVPAAMWPSVARMVAQDRLGTAYAIMFLIQNLGLMIVAPIVGWGEKPKMFEGGGEPFQTSMILLACLGVLGLVFAVLLKITDRTAKVSIEAPEQ